MAKDSRRRADWVSALLADLQARVEQYRRVNAFVEGAALLADLVREIDALARDGDDLLTPAQAATESGYSADQLRRLIRERRLTNHGSEGKALYRRSELPRKPSIRSSGLPRERKLATVGLAREQIARAVVNRHIGGD